MTIYYILTAMLLGAFLLGILLGVTVFKKQVKEPDYDKRDMISNDEDPWRGKQSSNYLTDDGRVGIDDVQVGAVIRATQTRDRAGSLTDEARKEITASKINFNRLGQGDENNPDDLKKIIGIDTKLEDRLNNLGIYNYSQLAAMLPEDIVVISKILDLLPERIVKDNWISQSQQLMQESE